MMLLLMLLLVLLATNININSAGGRTKTSNIIGHASDECKLTVSPNQIDDETQTVTVTYENITFQSQDDWVGVFNYSSGNMYWTAIPPIKYKLVGNLTSSGTVEFNLINRRTDYVFMYIEPYGPYRDVQAVSEKVIYNGKYKPMHVHLAALSPYSSDYTINLLKKYYLSQISSSNLKNNLEYFQKLKNFSEYFLSYQQNIYQIMWIQKEIDSPKIEYGFNPNELIYQNSALYYNQFSASDFCDQFRGKPAGTRGYWLPGYLSYVYLYDLQPNTIYYYRVGDNKFGWTQIYNFSSSPKFGKQPIINENTSPNDQNYKKWINLQHFKNNTKNDNNTKNLNLNLNLNIDRKLKFLAYGDMGQVSIDDSLQHSWDFNNRGEVYSKYISGCLEKNYIDGPNETSDFILHVGDISYAVGYLWEWDNFFSMNTKIFNRLPYHVGIGNHEYGNTDEWCPIDLSYAYSSQDSNGECGVAYNYYFPYASQNPSVDYQSREPWYTVDFGTIRTIMMSSEHDYSYGSNQYYYIKKMLEETNRELFPWIIITCHRPFYVNSEWDGDLDTGTYLREVYEDLFNENKVALGLYGHHHSYARTCPIQSNGLCVDDGNGMVHMVIGMAGYQLTTWSYPIPPLSYFEYADNVNYGFVHFTVENDTHLYGQFINGINNSLVEDFYVVNTYLTEKD